MARALTGDAGQADRVVDFVLRRGARFLPTWRPRNWFYHHTLLAARERALTPRQGSVQAPQTMQAQPGPAPDPLVPAAPDAEPGYVAFVRAIRGLPRQQGEAFILHRGERLNARLLGVTMDCSSAAAENHLNAATATLEIIAGDSLACYQRTLSRAYAALTPPAERIGPAVAPYARSYTRPLRLRRWARRTLLLAASLVLTWNTWRWRHELRAWLGPLARQLRARSGL